MTDYTELKRLATRIVEVQTSQDVPISKLFDDFEAAACPETILALIAENERLREDPGMRAIRSLRDDCADLMTERDQLKAEIAGLRTGYQAYERVNAELKAECEALRKDAERYRFLRNGPDGFDLSSADTMEEVDALIDAAMGKGEQP